MLAAFLLLFLALAAVFYAYQRYRQFKIFHFVGIVSADDERSWLLGNRDFLARPETAQAQYINKYGRLFGVFVLGPTPAVVVASHALIMEITIKKFDSFRDRPTMFFGANRMHHLLELTGEDWRRVRTTLMPSFSTCKLKQMSPIMERAIDVMVDVLNAKSGQDLEFRSVVQGLTLQVIGECVFATPNDAVRNQNDELLHHARTLFQTRGSSGRAVLSFCFPELRRCKKLMSVILKKAPANVAAEWILSRVRKIVRLRQEQQQHSSPSSAGREIDYITLMLEAIYNNNPHDDSVAKKKSVEQLKFESEDLMNDEKHTNSIGKEEEQKKRKAVKKFLTEDEMIGNAFVFLVAGYETTSTLLAHAVYCLATHPEVQDKLYDAIMQTFPNGMLSSVIDYTRVAAMPYLDYVVKEVLRLYPPVMHMARECNRKCTLSNGVTIPKGMIVLFPLHYLMHDPEAYEDPDQFRPERWANDASPAIPPFAWVPFGMGPRNCIGMRFAQIESKLALLRLVSIFHLLPCDRTDMPTLKLRTRISLTYAVNGVWIKVEKR